MLSVFSVVKIPQYYQKAAEALRMFANPMKMVIMWGIMQLPQMDDGQGFKWTIDAMDKALMDRRFTGSQTTRHSLRPCQKRAIAATTKGALSVVH